MNGFINRINEADRLESSFIESFNRRQSQYKIIKYGIESTNLAAVHNFIRTCYDNTSKFVRYIPDSVLISTNNNKPCKTTLIEFKAAVTGVQKDSFLNTLKSKCPQMIPAFSTKEDIFNIENDALELYVKLSDLGVRVVIVVYAGFRTQGNRLFSQFVEKIAVCNTYNPNTRGQNVGSGTWIANVNLASFMNISNFFYNEFSINTNIMNTISADIEKAFI